MTGNITEHGRHCHYAKHQMQKKLEKQAVYPKLSI